MRSLDDDGKSRWGFGGKQDESRRDARLGGSRRP